MKRAVAFAVGLIAAYIHWIGIILGGFMLGFAAKNVKQALAMGFAMGLVVYLLFLAHLAFTGLAGKFIQLGLLANVSLALTLLLSTLSAVAVNMLKS